MYQSGAFIELLDERSRNLRRSGRHHDPLERSMLGEAQRSVAHEDLDAKYEGAEMVIAFNADYLVDGVEAVDGDEVTLETIDALKPAVVRVLFALP